MKLTISFLLVQEFKVPSAENLVKEVTMQVHQLSRVSH